jgi:ubiquinone/menaquinone biosynthesis C-methylase UbiE
MHIDENTSSSVLRASLESYFRHQEDEVPEKIMAGRVQWRLSCFDSGIKYVDFIEREYFPVGGRRILDVACAWGGHAAAFASHGAATIAADFNDHKFSKLSDFAKQQGLNLLPLIADCQSLPFPDRSFDLIIALELIEHIPSVNSFATEVARLLTPGGLCIISTPARLRSILSREPHYELRGIALLPFRRQRFIATKVFNRSYPYPSTNQFSRASTAMQPFIDNGLSCQSVLTGKAKSLAGRYRPFQLLAEQYLWNFIIVQSPCP